MSRRRFEDHDRFQLRSVSTLQELINNLWLCYHFGLGNDLTIILLVFGNKLDPCPEETSSVT